MHPDWGILQRPSRTDLWTWFSPLSGTMFLKFPLISETLAVVLLGEFRCFSFLSGGDCWVLVLEHVQSAKDSEKNANFKIPSFQSTSVLHFSKLQAKICSICDFLKYPPTSNASLLLPQKQPLSFGPEIFMRKVFPPCQPVVSKRHDFAPLVVTMLFKHDVNKILQHHPQKY